MKLREENHRFTNKNAIYNKLKNAIQFLELKPGSTINEADIAANLGVSRTPVREALIRLSDELFVDIYPQRGTYVSKIDLSLVNEMAYMRNILEVDICLKMCREKAKLRDFVDEKLYLLNLALKRHDSTEYILNDKEFHHAIFTYGNHEAIWNIISGTQAHITRIWTLDFILPDSLEKSYNEHMKIIESIENGNEEQLIKAYDGHFDHNFGKREDIIKMYPEYFV